MDFEIIDFHTHPFILEDNNICAHKEFCHMSPEDTREIFKALGISKICGSVIDISNDRYKDPWDKIRQNNDTALRLRDLYDDFYVPGFHVHPDYVEESIEEIRRMHKEGVHLMGELVPYMNGWSGYSREDFSLLLEEAQRYNMIVNFHSMDEDEMDLMVQRHPKVVFVAAHPGEYSSVMRHIQRMKMSKNYYLDLSGYGIFRYGMLRRVIDTCGVDRVLFGSDFPTCNPAMYLGGVKDDLLITDQEKQMILAENAKRLLKLP